MQHHGLAGDLVLWSRTVNQSWAGVDPGREENYRPGREDYRPGREDYRPGREDYKPGREDFRCSVDQYHSFRLYNYRILSGV